MTEETKKIIEETSKRNEEIFSNFKNFKIGITPKDIQDLYNYVCGISQKPLFIDKFTADGNDRIKDMLLIMTLLQMSNLPTLIAYREKLIELLINKATNEDVDKKDLSIILSNIMKDTMSILDSATKALQTINQFSTLNSRYRNVVDSMLMLSDDKFKELQEHFFKNE